MRNGRPAVSAGQSSQLDPLSHRSANANGVHLPLSVRHSVAATIPGKVLRPLGLCLFTGLVVTLALQLWSWTSLWQHEHHVLRLTLLYRQLHIGLHNASSNNSGYHGDKHGALGQYGWNTTRSQAVAATHPSQQIEVQEGNVFDQVSKAYGSALTQLSQTLQLAQAKAAEAAALRQQLNKLLLQQRQQQRGGQRAQTIAVTATELRTAVIATGNVGGTTAAASNSVWGSSSAGLAMQSAADAQTAFSRYAWAGHKASWRIRIFIGVYTAFDAPGAGARYNYAARRAALRDTWFPGNHRDRARLESQHGVVLRFVIGSTWDSAAEIALRAEEQQHGGFMRLPMQEDYRALANKTRTFFKAVTDTWQPDWVIKMDDDVYLNIPRLLHAVQQWDKMKAQYVGCMKHGMVLRQPGTRWFEPSHLLTGPSYWLHAYGSIYAIAGHTARSVIGGGFSHLRLLANEDTSVGLWMLAADVKYFEDMRLCSPICTVASVGVLRNDCAGLCHPLEDLQAHHHNPNCSTTPQGQLLYHRSHPEHTAFEQMWVAH